MLGSLEAGAEAETVVGKLGRAVAPQLRWEARDGDPRCQPERNFFLIFLNVYLFLRETEREQGGAEREGDTEFEAGSRL